MSMTTDLARFVDNTGFCGSCARGIVLTPGADGLHVVGRCPCVPDTMTEPPVAEPPIPDPQGAPLVEDCVA